MRFSWEKLLCEETLRQKEKTPSSWVDYPLDPFEQDYREIISSVSFRRLQDKAQVYQLEKGDFVRTRLTHSLEVSTVAKQLGTMMIYHKKWNGIPAFRTLPADSAHSVPTILACAGLLHDMGNPPFGHEGEYAIGAWFRKRFADDAFSFRGRPVREWLTEEMKTDLCSFEGNAQVLRMLSMCRFPSEEQEANVSFATMSILLKYPVAATEMNKDDPDLRVHKFGYYVSEKEMVKKIRRATGVDLPDEPHARNPLTYLLEAADDIAYVASDIEDAVAKKTVSIAQLTSFMSRKIAEIPEEGDEKHQMQLLTVQGILNNLLMRTEHCDGDENREISAFHEWTNYLRNWLMYVAASSFVENSEAIMNGTFRGDLLEGSLHKYTIRILKNEMRANVYPRLAEIHLAADTILTGLMDRFGKAVVPFETDQAGDPVLEACMQMIPERFKNAYRQDRTGDEGYDLYLRLRMLTDYIASMTDGHALELYKKLNVFSYEA